MGLLGEIFGRSNKCPCGSGNDADYCKHRNNTQGRTGNGSRTQGHRTGDRQHRTGGKKRGKQYVKPMGKGV